MQPIWARNELGRARSSRRFTASTENRSSKRRVEVTAVALAG